MKLRFLNLTFCNLGIVQDRFCNGQTQGMIIRNRVTFIKHMSVRFIKFMSCKNAERGFSSGALLLLTVISTPNEIKLDINIPDFPKNENGLT